MSDNPWADAESAIRTRLSAEWAAVTPAIAIHYENVTPNPQPNASSFLALEILWGEAFQASIGAPGANLYRHPGVIWAHVFVKNNKGTKDALFYAGKFAGIFRTKTFSGVTTKTPSIGKKEPASDDGNWYRVTVSIPFHYDATF